MVHAGLVMLIMLSTVIVSGLASSLASSGKGRVSSLVPNLMGKGMNLLYLFSNSLIRASSKNSLESFAMWSMISVPLSLLSASSKVYSGEPSQVQCAVGVFW